MRPKAMTLLSIACVLAALSFNLATQAVAQEDGNAAKASAKTTSGGGAKPKKQTKIDFEDELVEGELKKPELFYLLQKKQFNFKRLIKLREDFLPEMRRDADEVKRTRSK